MCSFSVPNTNTVEHHCMCTRNMRFVLYIKRHEHKIFIPVNIVFRISLLCFSFRQVFWTTSTADPARHCDSLPATGIVQTLVQNAYTTLKQKKPIFCNRRDKLIFDVANRLTTKIYKNIYFF